jgi:hypothetical protein
MQGNDDFMANLAKLIQLNKPDLVLYQSTIVLIEIATKIASRDLSLRILAKTARPAL